MADSPTIETSGDFGRRLSDMVADLTAHGVLPHAAERAAGQALVATSAFAAWAALLSAGPAVDPLFARELLQRLDAFPFRTESMAAFLRRTGRSNPADRPRPPAIDRYRAARRHQP